MIKKNIVAERNRDIPKYVNENEGLKDFYDKKKKPKVSKDDDREKYKKMLADLKRRKRRGLLKTNKHLTGSKFLRIRVGAIMPILVQLHFKNGKKESHKIPAEIWEEKSRGLSASCSSLAIPWERVLIDPD